MSRAPGRQTWPAVKHIIGEGVESVTVSQWGDDGELVVRGQGVNDQGDDTLTIEGANVESEDGVVHFTGRVVE